VRRSYLSILVLVATLISIVATPAVTFADDDDRGRGRGGDNDRRDRDRDNDKRDRDRERDNDRRGREGDDRFNNNFRTVGICHATGSARNPFVFIRVAEESVFAHQRHGDIVNVNSQQDCPTQGGNGGIAGVATGSINVGDTVCREGESCVFTVWQSRGTGTATVNFTTEDATASGGPSCTPGVDYVTGTGTVTVAAASTVTLTVQTCTDNLSGPDERFRVRLTGTSSGRINDDVGRGIILETSVALGGANTVLATTDSLGQASINWGSMGGIEHRVYLVSGSSCLFTTDFRSFPSTATSGMLTGLIPNTLYCLQARRVEIGGTETVLAATSTGLGTTAGSIAINDTTCVEGAICSFLVTQTGGTAAATVTFSTGNGTAIGGVACGVGADFAHLTGGTISVPANGSVPITVTTCADGIIDPNETFFVVLNTTTSGTIADTTGAGTIAGG